MLFSKKNFRQFFSGRPSRRRAGYSVPAQVQTLQNKVLLSAGPVDVDETSYDETMSDETSYDETMTDETSYDETMTDETSYDETMTDETSYDETMSDETSYDETMSDETSYDETMTDETSYDETMTDETSYDETMTDETSYDETMTDETSYDETMTDETTSDDENLPRIGTVSVNAVNGELQVSGQVDANGGDLSGLSLEWGEGVSGEGLSIDGETGEITGTLSTGTT
jgi:hypothetical protein